MENKLNLNIRVNDEVKQSAEKILDTLGISMSAAINIYLNQIILNNGIPFDVSIPNGPSSLNIDLMDIDELNQKLEEGYNDSLSGKLENASLAFERFRQNH